MTHFKLENSVLLCGFIVTVSFVSVQIKLLIILSDMFDICNYTLFIFIHSQTFLCSTCPISNKTNTMYIHSYLFFIYNTVRSNQLCSFSCLCSESILYVEKLQRAHTRAFPVWTCHMWVSQPFFNPLTVLHWGQAHE